MATSYYFWGHQRVGSLRGREKMVHWCIHLFLPYFLSSFYHFLSFFLSVLSLLLVSYYSPVVGCSPPPLSGLSFSWVTLSGCLLLSYHGFPPLGPSSSFSFMTTSSFYRELIQWDFPLLPIGFHQLFLACYGHSFSTAHQPIGYSTTTSA